MPWLHLDAIEMKILGGAVPGMNKFPKISLAMRQSNISIMLRIKGKWPPVKQRSCWL